MVGHDPVAGLLEDLDTIAGVARAGVLTASQDKLEAGETRPAAILFLDVVGFTKLAREMDSDHLARLIDRTFRIFELTAKAHGGYCDKVVGDAGLYVFLGDPGHPPACESALAAALALVQRSKQVAQTLHGTGADLAVRVGIAFGEVTRQRVGGEGWQVTVMGDTVNIAQRLESSAPVGGVLTTNFVLDLTGDRFSVEPHGRLDLKGFGQVETFLVTGERPPEVRLRSPVALLTPLVGREPEIAEGVARIRAWWETEHPQASLDPAATGEKVAGRNRLLLLAGPPAIGKSRLAHEISVALAAQGPLCQGLAHCLESGSPLEFAAEVARTAGLDAANLPARWERLCALAAEAVSPEYGRRQAERLPALAYLLGCKAVDTAGIRQADPQAFQTALRLALRACLELASHERGEPLLLTVEDLQWEGEVRELVTDLVTNTCLPRPLVVVATARPTFQAVAGEHGAGETHRIEVGRLTDEEGMEIVSRLLPGLSLPEPVANSLAERADGLPYYFEEFARMLERRGLVAKGEDGSFAVAREIGHLTMPPDVKMLILGRLDSLPQSERDLLGNASVLGRRFKVELLRRLEERLGEDGSATMDARLSELEEEGVLAMVEGGNCLFRQVLAQEAAYGALLSVNRRLLHGLVADLLAASHVPGGAEERDVLAELVRHLEGSNRFAGAHERACDLLLALSRLGHVATWDNWRAQAEALWEQAQKADATLPSLSPALLRADAQRAHLAGRPEEAAALAEEALAGYRAAGDRHGEVAVVAALAAIRRAQGRMEEAQSLVEQGLEIARAEGNLPFTGVLLNSLGILEKSRGRPEAARQAWREAQSIWAEVGNRSSEAKAKGNEAALLDETGDATGASVVYEECADLFRSVGDRRSEAIVLSNLGNALSSLGKTRQARPRLERALLLCREIGDLRTEGHTLTNLGGVHSREGRAGEARERLAAAVNCYAGIGYRRGEGFALAALARVRLELGEVATAAADLARAEAALEGQADMLALGFVRSAQARLGLATNEPAQAAARLAEAREIAGQLGLAPGAELLREIEAVAALSA